MSGRHSKQDLLLRSLAIAGGLTALKVTVFYFTNSVAMLASAADSLMDFVLSFANFAFVRSAERPADQKHAYGHGKIESLGGLLQSAVIAAVTLGIAAVSVRRLFHPEPVADPMAGAAVTVVALAVSLWHIRNLSHSASESGSHVMRAEYLHYATDVLVYIGVIAAFILSTVTGSQLWDPLVSLLIVIYLIKNVVDIFRQSTGDLLDEQLPAEELAELDRVIKSFDPRVVEYHNLRTRRVGPVRFIEFHLVLSHVTLFTEAHDLTHALIDRVAKAFPGAEVNIHADPADTVRAARGEKA